MWELLEDNNMNIFSWTHRVRLVHLDGHFIDGVRRFVDHFEEAGAAQSLCADRSGQLETWSRVSTTSLKIFKVTELKRTSSFSRNSRTSGSWRSMGWFTTLWRYLETHKTNNHTSHSVTAEVTTSLFFYLSKAPRLLSRKSAEEESSFPTFTFVIPVPPNTQSYRQINKDMYEVKAGYHYPECFSLGVEGRLVHLVHVFQRVSRRGLRSRWSVVGLSSACYGTWAVRSGNKKKCNPQRSH